MATQDGDFVTAEGLAGALGTVGACDVLYEYGGDSVSNVTLDFTNPPEYKCLGVCFESSASTFESAVIPLSFLCKMTNVPDVPVSFVDGNAQLLINIDTAAPEELHVAIVIEHANTLFSVYGIK